MAEVACIKISILQTLCGGMIIVCRILQNEPECSFVKATKTNTLIIIIIIIIINAVELSLGGRSPYTSTEKTNK